MGIKTVYSTKETIDDVISDIQSQAQGAETRMVLFFASAKFEAQALSTRMGETFSGASVFGCTTAGEIVTGKMLKGSVVAMLFGPDIISDVKIEVLENIKSEIKVEQALKSIGDYYQTPPAELDFEKYVGIILIDGLSMAEETIMEKIGDQTDTIVIGGSAGDDLQFSTTYVFADGKAYTNAAVLAMLKPAVGFDFLKTQSFNPLGKTLVATKVDEAQRKVLEFNDKPAADAYAESLGVSVEEAPNFFMSNPIGLMMGDEPYVRSPQKIQDKSMCFYCNIKNGMELQILESTQIVDDTRTALEEKKKDLGNISGIINFHCILRTLELDQKGQADDYGNLFSDIPTVGFSTYGEEFVGHINQTSTMLLFK